MNIELDEVIAVIVYGDSLELAADGALRSQPTVQ